MNLLVGVSAPDDHTFVIELSEAYYPMLTELGCIRPFAMISPNCMIDGSTKDGVSGYIGTGPYVLTDFETDQYAVFERNENYWGEKPEIERITVKVIPDNQTRIMALESGEIDLILVKICWMQMPSVSMWTVINLKLPFPILPLQDILY